MARENKQYEINDDPVGLDGLYLDPNNYRLIHEPDYVKVDESKIKDKTVQRRTFRLLAGDKNQHILDLLDSFKANGYLPVDQIQVRQLDDGGYAVVEGNRRIAALKYLQRAHEENDVDLGHLKETIFSSVPVVLYTDSDEKHHLVLMALKHISGNKKWGDWNQAKLLEKMHWEYGLSENKICKQVAISKVELRRSLRALSFMEQYESSDYGDQANERKFPIFREIARNAALKDWLDWDDGYYKATNVPNCELFFSWISREPVEEDDSEELSYGDKYREPALVTRDHIRMLGSIIDDRKAIEQFKQTRDINSAYRFSDYVFQERQQAAVNSVSNEIDALGKMTIQEENLPELENVLGRLQGIVDRAKASGLSGVEQKAVFHDRVDAHFSDISITGYKRLQNVKISKLSRINLFAGINNSGKTTLLEAVYLLCRQNDFAGLLEVIRRRGKVAEDRINPEWFLGQLTNEINISGRFDNNDATVQIRHYKEENSGIDQSRYLESIEITSEFSKSSQESLTRIYKGRERETHASGIKMLCPSVFSSPFFLNEPHRYAPFYHKSTQSKSLATIFEFIREKVVSSITDIRLVDEWQRFLVADTNYDYTLDLTEYGEGLQRIFFISLLFASAANGVLLIDEFENAIHTELIGNFADFISGLADIFNTQVFLTSHSKECIDSFIKNIPDINDLSACALVEHEGQILAREFSGKEFRGLVEAGNVDLRRAR
ncbi:MAG: AAA family ATPase [bacterium]|nr:AAA family ATPase [bacterium]